ncbi:hypothetical protein [Paenibacillus sp. P36]|uniref:hypothetical protein n=1 Tax=Paenibacillus sp. P36 TaxID=3342538 RepID=UPI0038B400EC
MDNYKNNKDLHDLLWEKLKQYDQDFSSKFLLDSLKRVDRHRFKNTFIETIVELFRTPAFWIYLFLIIMFIPLIFLLIIWILGEA